SGRCARIAARVAVVATAPFVRRARPGGYRAAGVHAERRSAPWARGCLPKPILVLDLGSPYDAGARPIPDAGSVATAAGAVLLDAARGFGHGRDRRRVTE